jgi:hypothetical protein
MMAASHYCISNVIRTTQESERTKSCGFCNRIHCSHRCEYSECRSISRRLKLLLGGGYYGPFTLFHGGKAEDYIKVSREHEHGALLPRKVAGIYMAGPQKPFRRTKRNIYCLEGTELRSLSHPARSVLSHPGSYNWK